MKLLFKIAVIVIVLFTALFLARNIILKAAVEKGVEMATGLPLQIERFHLDLFGTRVLMKDMKLFNPSGFSDSVMAQVPEVYANIDLSDLFHGTIHLKQFRLDVTEFSVVKSSGGNLNLNYLKSLKKEPSQVSKQQEELGLMIDHLELHLGKVTYKDYTRVGAEPSVREFSLNLREEYNNVTSISHLVSLIVLRIMINTPIAVLTGFDLNSLQNTVSSMMLQSAQFAGGAVSVAQSSVVQATSQAKEAVSVTTEGVSNTLESIGGTAKTISGGLKDAAGTVTDKFNLPFGSKNE